MPANIKQEIIPLLYDTPFFAIPMDDVISEFKKSYAVYSSTAWYSNFISWLNAIDAGIDVCISKGIDLNFY